MLGPGCQRQACGVQEALGNEILQYMAADHALQVMVHEKLKLAL